MKVLTVVGTRPDAIKMAPVITAFANDPVFEAKVCVTAQHREMLDQALDLFKIQPDFDLNLMQCDQELSDLTSNVLLGMRGVYQAWRPDFVLVHGDTTTTLAAALSAYYAKIKIGHVEAGLRTNNKYSPWPEELNRSLTGALADLHFAPTPQARRNLLREGVAEETIYVTGNTVIDALFDAMRRLREDTALRAGLERRFDFIDSAKRLVLVTGHRRENWGKGLENVCRALGDIAERGDVQVAYPVHLNPNVSQPTKRILGGEPGVFLIEPLDYAAFVYLMQRSALIITDSGGVQEEAPSLGKPVLVTREITERPEAVEAGAVKLVGSERAEIVLEANRVLDDSEAYAAMSSTHSPYGDGKAAARIHDVLKRIH